MAATLKSIPPAHLDDERDSDLLLHIPSNAYTLAGFRAWVHSDDFPEKQRVTFLNGEIYLDMSKEDIFTHASVKTAAAGTMFNLNEEKDFGKLFINGVLVTNIPASVSNNPDMVAVFWDSLESGKVRYVKTKKERGVEIEGSPDWVLEIVSDSSVVKDTIDLRDAYHRAEIGEYWLIDARGDEVVFQILHWRKAGYVAAPHKTGWQRSRAFGRSFMLSRMRDRLGDWNYLLAVKEA
jgi:Uma2 family endonuclease